MAEALPEVCLHLGSPGLGAGEHEDLGRVAVGEGRGVPGPLHVAVGEAEEVRRVPLQAPFHVALARVGGGEAGRAQLGLEEDPAPSAGELED